MCGIAGFYGTKTIEDKKIHNCLKLMQRRGPDTNGQFHYTSNNNINVYLLHSRLSIIDFDKRANQPFISDSNVLIYNG